jgi:hypothetical protein
MRLENEDASSDFMVRVPWPAASQFPSEKVPYEAATTEYVRLKARIPVAPVLHDGSDPSIALFPFPSCSAVSSTRTI